MPEFVIATVSDLRCGRQSWRVLTTLALPAFLVALVVALINQPF